MSNESPTIQAMQRDRVGTRYSRRLRQEGKLPAVIYGHGSDPMSIVVNSKETLALLHHGAHVLNIAVEGGDTETCLVKDLQFGYLGDDVIHVDFARVNLDETVQVLVRLELVGEVEADIEQRKISVTSPIARALIGKKKGDYIEVSTPKGVTSYEIKSVRFK